MRDAELFLISHEEGRDSLGGQVLTQISRAVFAQVQSASRSEYFAGGRNGLNPELVFYVFAEDYNGETECEYQGKRYGIYRTYLNEEEDYIELYAERKGGTNG